MKWFRVYHDALHDPKLLRLSAEHFRGWFNLLCIASANDDRGHLPPVEDIASILRISVVKATSLVGALVEASLVDRDPSGQMSPHNWESRQQKTDDVNARTRKFREKKAKSRRDATLQDTHERPATQRSQERDCNVAPNGSVTPRVRADSDTDSDTEKESPSYDVDSSRGDVVGDVDPRIVSPEHRETVAHARASYGDGFAEVVAEQGRDIGMTLDDSWDCYRAAIDTAKRSGKPISNLHAYCIRTAGKYQLTGLPSAPFAVEPSAPKVDRNGRPILGPEEKARQKARLDAKIMGDIHGR